MKWVESEADARAARDTSIACMARLDHTVFLVQQSADDVYFTKYRRACGMLMGEFVDIVNRAGFDFPHLVPTEDEWKAVIQQRVAANELVRDERKIDANVLRTVVSTVRERVKEIEHVSPRIIGETMLQYLEELDAAIDAWETPAGR
jgi:hypothetical protein